MFQEEVTASAFERKFTLFHPSNRFIHNEELKTVNLNRKTKFSLFKSSEI